MLVNGEGPIPLCRNVFPTTQVDVPTNNLDAGPFLDRRAGGGQRSHWSHNCFLPLMEEQPDINEAHKEIDEM
jgi:hypothetical protein